MSIPVRCRDIASLIAFLDILFISPKCIMNRDKVSLVLNNRYRNYNVIVYSYAYIERSLWFFPSFLSPSLS